MSTAKKSKDLVNKKSDRVHIKFQIRRLSLNFIHMFEVLLGVTKLVDKNHIIGSFKENIMMINYKWRRYLTFQPFEKKRKQDIEVSK